MVKPHFITLPIQATVEEAIALLRKSATKGSIFYAYVVGAKNALEGVLSMRDLLLAHGLSPLSELVRKSPVCLDEDADIPTALKAFTRSGLLTIPVVNSEKQILGVLYAHELAGLHNSTTEALLTPGHRAELFELLGIHAEEEERKSIPKVALGRLPWLSINIVGGAACALLIEHMGSHIPRAVAILAFVPVLLIISESLGMQAASLAIANLQGRGSIRARTPWQLLRRELTVASILGVLVSMLLGSVVFLWQRSWPLSLVIMVTTLVACIIITAVGNLVPVLLHRWKLDPRISAGPVVLSISDCTTLFIFLSLALLLTAL